MKKLILTLFSAALVAWALYAPPEASCQVGAPCAPAQSAITFSAAELEGVSILRADPRSGTADLSSFLTGTGTALQYTLTIDYPTGSTLTDVTETVTDGSVSSELDAVAYECSLFYNNSCESPSNTTISVSGIKSDCGRAGTTGTASTEWVMGFVQAPSMGCLNPSRELPAPPNDTVTITVDDLVQTATGADGLGLFFGDINLYWPTETGIDGCSVTYGTLAELDPTPVLTFDTSYITTYLEGTVAAGATGLCCVPETAFETPAQSGCLYQGGSLAIAEVTATGSKCSFEGTTGQATGAGSTDICASSITITDAGGVCPQDWCTLNPGDPACGGGP